MVKWKFGLNLGILETWTELLVHFSFLKWIWNSAFQCFVPKSSNWMMMGFCWPLWWLPTHTFYTFYTPGRKCLRGGRCRQVLGFAHLLHATFGRPVNSIKNASKRIKLPSLDLPVTSVTVGRHLERRRALCRCSSRSRWSRGRRKAPLPWRRAGAGAFPTPNQTSAYQLSFQIIYWALQQKCNHIVVGPCCCATWTNHLQQFRLQNHPFESSLSPTSSRRESWASSLSGFSSGCNVSVLLFWDHFFQWKSFEIKSDINEMKWSRNQIGETRNDWTFQMVSENSARGPPPHNPTPPKKEDRRPHSFTIQPFFCGISITLVITSKHLIIQTRPNSDELKKNKQKHQKVYIHV